MFLNLERFLAGKQTCNLMLHIPDVGEFLQEKPLVESEQINLAGIDWAFTAQMINFRLTLKVNASHPSSLAWHTKIGYNFRGPNIGSIISDFYVVLLTEKTPTSLTCTVPEQVLFSSRLFLVSLSNSMRK